MKKYTLTLLNAVAGIILLLFSYLGLKKENANRKHKPLDNATFIKPFAIKAYAVKDNIINYKTPHYKLSLCYK